MSNDEQASVAERSRDITAAHSAGWLGAVLDVMPSAVMLVNADGRIELANHRAARLFGYETAELRDLPIDALVPDDKRAAHAAERTRFMQSPGTREMGAGRELFGVRKDGSRLPIEVGLDVLRSGSDVMVLASIFDASERHAARQRADEASALAQSIIDSAAFPIIATDIDGRVLEFSPSAERVLRLRKADLLGQRLPIVVREQAGSAVPLIELDDSAEPGPARGRRGAMPFGNGEMREYVWRCADGTRVPIHLAVSGLRNRSGTLFGYIAILYDLSERKRYEEHMRIIAEQDALTGLPNRLVLHERLAAAIGAVEREGGQVGVLLIDLDNFKRVNDSLGHYMGDKLLGLVAARLRSCIRVNDMVARMGGDEFVVVLAGIRRPIIAQLVARKIVRELCRPLELDGHTVEISPSIGICLYPTDAVTVDDLIKNADTAMYAAKEAGRGRFMPFSHEMADAASERWRIEHAMRLAMGRNEFCVAYQPQVDLRSARVTGVEALLRWPGVDGATTSPAHFIPVAEQTGLIAPIGEWVLRTACREISQLDADGVPGLRLSINLSPRQLRESNMIEIVSDTLADNNFDPERLELEITESAFVDDDVAHAIMQLHELGVRVAIDDFGTGYSSLSQVTRFPLDRLKIDRVFVQDVAAGMRHAAVTAAIIAMGRHMGIDVVAEGIETEAQARALREQGCREGQGFLYSQAVPIGELAEAIHRIESRG